MARIAFIVDEMFEDSELRKPYDKLREAGHEVVIVGTERKKELKGKNGKETVKADKAVHDISASDFDALVIPGGYSPDHLRTNAEMVQLTRDLFDAGKPVAAICHAGSMLAEADVARGHTLTSWPSIKTDLINAGATWVDREVVIDDNLITSRKPADLPAFCEAILTQLRLSEPRPPQPSRERRGVAQRV
jgi:protease I